MNRRPPGSFLIINTFGIGDVLFSTPLLRILRESFPGSRLYYLCNKKTEPVLKNHPLLEKVFVYERDDFVAAQRRSFWSGLKMYLDFIGLIRKERIECAIDLSLNTPFGFFALAAGIPKRCGLNFKGRGVFLTQKMLFEGFSGRHVVDHYLDVLKLLGVDKSRRQMEVYTDAASRAWAAAFVERKQLKAKTIVGIAPCGGDAFGKNAYIKRWPAEHYARLIDMLVEQTGAEIFIFAGPKEKQDVEKILACAGQRAFCHEFSAEPLERIIALVEKCSLFIGNDTGPLRFADAMGKKLIALFGPVDDIVYGPYPLEKGRTSVMKKDLACRPCYNRFKLDPCASSLACLSGISPEEVMREALRLLDSRSAVRGGN